VPAVLEQATIITWVQLPGVLNNLWSG